MADPNARDSALGKRTVRDLDITTGQSVLARVDFNVPLEGGRVVDDARIRAALPTIELLLERGVRLVLCSHLGRPQGRDPETSLAPVSARLDELVDAHVHQAPEVVGPEVRRGVDRLEPGAILVLENTRWERGETENDPALARELAALGDAYVNDAFGAAHRAHASTAGVAEFLRPAVAGLLLEREVTTLRRVVESPERPLVVVLGGAKVTDKIALIDRFLDTADTLLIGGAMCFSFFRAQGIATGDSLVEDEGVELAREALAKADSSSCRLRLPVDIVAGDSFSADAEHRELGGTEVPDGWMGLDIGPRTAAAYAEEIAKAGTVFWNGPMGAFELAPFAAGTRAVGEAVARAGGTTIVGGGDSGAAMAEFGLADEVDHLSTGGGASLELLEGKPLPGVEVLDDA
ncbi:MAG TPA: phosphoglycerate kinase [Thermoleophilaceae bacterium]|nr:phosphoglycerate kinase [Thermoleophilaceae bacterium]